MEGQIFVLLILSVLILLHFYKNQIENYWELVVEYLIMYWNRFTVSLYQQA